MVVAWLLAPDLPRDRWCLGWAPAIGARLVVACVGFFSVPGINMCNFEDDSFP